MKRGASEVGPGCALMDGMTTLPELTTILGADLLSLLIAVGDL